MASFSTRNVSRAEVPAPRSAIWEVVTDPVVLARLTPLLDRISVDGDHWCWQLSGIKALGVEIAPSFTEHMVFTPESELTYRHDPPPGSKERAGAEGTYQLTELGPDRTGLFIDLTLTVELPLPSMSRRAVEKVMASTMDRTGAMFAERLYDHLGVDPADATRETLSS